MDEEERKFLNEMFNRTSMITENYFKSIGGKYFEGMRERKNLQIDKSISKKKEIINKKKQIIIELKGRILKLDEFIDYQKNDIDRMKEKKKRMK